MRVRIKKAKEIPGVFVKERSAELVKVIDMRFENSDARNYLVCDDFLCSTLFLFLSAILHAAAVR